MSIAFREAPFKTTGGTSSRSLDDRFGEVINVRDFASLHTGSGTMGSGLGNDAPCIQAAFDLAFGTAGSPHGSAGKYSNRPVYFPAGHYVITDQLNLTRVVGGRIFGAGRGCTYVQFTGTVAGGATKTSALRINGAVDLCVERIAFAMSDATHDNSYVLDLDWDGTAGGEGLHGNIFHHCSFGIKGTSAVIIGDSDNEGYNNLFLQCDASCDGASNDCGYDVRGAEALNNQIIGGGGTEADVAFVRCPSGGGSMHVMNASVAGNAIDFVMESSHIMTLNGIRTESTQLLRQENGTVVIQGFTNAGGQDTIEVNGGKCMVEGAHLNYPAGANIRGTGGEVYVSAIFTDPEVSATLLADFAGTIAWNPQGFPEP
jgi:hypothetical protein